MINKYIHEILKQIVLLLEINNFDIYKVISFKKAIISLEKFDIPHHSITEEDLKKIKGIGSSISKHIIEINNTGTCQLLENLLKNTPNSVIEMIKIKGLGPKKIYNLWKNFKITSIIELQNALKEDKINSFGEKTRKSLLESINFYFKNKGFLLYKQAIEISNAYTKQEKEKGKKLILVGDLRRYSPVVKTLDYILIISEKEYKNNISINIPNYKQIKIKNPINKNDYVSVNLYFSYLNRLGSDLIKYTGSEEFLNDNIVGKKLYSDYMSNFASEQQVFDHFKIKYVPPEMRELKFELKSLKTVIEKSDLKGILHVHTSYSDGIENLENIAETVKNNGFQYLGITDHSKSAFYAQGLKDSDVLKQHLEIEKLNKKNISFKIFKGIESDILLDGSLDYKNEVLQTFDFIISSIHSSFNMTKKQATKRLIKAITNQYTTIIGHPTGRLLLQRDGYPIDYKSIIDACKEHKVAIELNCNPKRLDLDWKEMDYAIKQNVFISINPDAHSLKDLDNIDYGVILAKKAGLIKSLCLNYLNTDQISLFFNKNI